MNQPTKLPQQLSRSSRDVLLFHFTRLKGKRSCLGWDVGAVSMLGACIYVSICMQPKVHGDEDEDWGLVIL